MFKREYLHVPIELIQFAHKNKMHRALGLYLLLKASCDGHIVLTKEHKSRLMSLLGIRDNRSFRKHLQRLITENWIGHNATTGVYYIRGSKSLRKRYGFRHNTAAVFYIANDARNITAFVHGAIINNEIRRRTKARNARVKKLAGSSALLKESALHELAGKGLISEYIGLSLSVIGKILGVSQSQADRIKVNLKSLGYVKLKVKHKVICELDEPDFTLIKFMPPNRRYSVVKKIKKKKVVYEFRERSFDEIVSRMEFKNQRAVVRKLGLGAAGGGSK